MVTTEGITTRSGRVKGKDGCQDLEAEKARQKEAPEELNSLAAMGEGRRGKLPSLSSSSHAHYGLGLMGGRGQRGFT